MSDPTAAARARRYRARRRQDAASTPELLEVLELLGDIRAMLVELVNIGGQPVDKRDATVTPAAERDVTNRHGGEGARVNPDDAGPTGPSVVDGETVTGVTLAGEELEASEIVELAELDPPPIYRPSPFVDQLERLIDEPRTIAELAEILECGSVVVVDGLRELERHGRARRRLDRWMAASSWVDDASATIRCTSYLAHQLTHRRDPETGRFRCYLCEPGESADVKRMHSAGEGRGSRGGIRA